MWKMPGSGPPPNVEFSTFFFGRVPLKKEITVPVFTVIVLIPTHLNKYLDDLVYGHIFTILIQNIIEYLYYKQSV